MSASHSPEKSSLSLPRSGDGPFAVIRTGLEKPSDSHLDVAKRVEGLGVQAAVVHNDAINLKTGEIDPSLGFVIGEESVYPQVANTIRVVKRLPPSLRSEEAFVPLLNRDSIIASTVDKLKMAEELGELTVPTKVVTGKELSPQESHDALDSAINEWGAVILKPRAGYAAKGIITGTAEELHTALTTLLGEEKVQAYIAQPYVDTRPAIKPGLPENLQNRPTSLRVIGSVTKLPGLEAVAEIYTAVYRYGESDDRLYHGDDGNDEYFYIQKEGESIEESHPELKAAFNVVKAALIRRNTTSPTAEHGIRAQYCASDVMFLPKDSKFGYDEPDAAYKCVVIEQNSSPARLQLAKHPESKVTREAWHKGEARFIAGVAVQSYMKENK